MAFMRTARRLHNVSVVLLADVRGLGVAGEEKVVAGGYMRNFLSPKGIAVHSTPENVSNFKTVEAGQAGDAKRSAIQERVAQYAKRLNSKPLEIKRNSNDGIKTFPGHVTAQNIADAALKKFNIELDAEHLSVLASKEGFPLGKIGEVQLSYALDGVADAEVQFPLNIVKR